MAKFKRNTALLLPRTRRTVSEEATYWEKLSFPVVVKEVGPIDYLSFSSTDSSRFIATCSSKIQLYSSTTSEVIRTYSKFRYAAYGGKFRPNGDILISGSDEGLVRLFDIKSKSVLRTFNGHTRATHRCDFNKGGTKIISFSDDKSAILWDIPAEKPVLKFNECHGDYIRAGLASQRCEDVFVSGSYDHAVKLLDARVGKPTMTLDHGAPVEALLMFPTGCLVISAGGDVIKVWDIIGGRLLAQMAKHHKTITCLAFARNHERVLSAGLDRHVKIYDTSMYQAIHTLTYPSPILSLSVSSDDRFVVVGMADGLLSIRQRQTELSTTPKRKWKASDPQQVSISVKESSTELAVMPQKQNRVRSYDIHLRKFRYSKALDATLSDYYICRKPSTTVMVMKELIRRGALGSALAGRTDESLIRVIQFLSEYITDDDYSSVLIDVADEVLNVCTPLNQKSKQVQDALSHLKRTVDREADHMNDIQEVLGMLEMIQAGARLSE